MASTTIPFRALTHIHVERESRDCDGRYTNNRIQVPAEGFTVREDFTFLVGLMHEYGSHFTLERGVTADGSPYAEYSAATEEGFEWERLEGCGLNCDLGARLYRDHTAESMGY